MAQPHQSFQPTRYHRMPKFDGEDRMQSIQYRRSYSDHSQYSHQQRRSAPPDLQAHQSASYHRQHAHATFQYSQQIQRAQMQFQQQQQHMYIARVTAADHQQRSSIPIPQQRQLNAQQRRTHSNSQSRSKQNPQHSNGRKLQQSCSLPEDDEVLRASVSLLHAAPDVTDGYSSDNVLYYGHISIVKPAANDKTNYLTQLSKEILSTSNATAFEHSTDGAPAAPDLDRAHVTDATVEMRGGHSLYSALTDRLTNDDEDEVDSESDDSLEKMHRDERERKEVIRTRQKMRRHPKPEKTCLLFRSGSVGAAYCNLSASTLGCSVLCIPYVFSLAGLLNGAVILVVIVCLQSISLRLLLQCQKCTGIRSMQHLTILYLKSKFGVLGVYFINFIIFGFCFTQCIAILIALADLIQPVFHDYFAHSFLSNRGVLLVLVTMFILLPLSFKERPTPPKISGRENLSARSQELHPSKRMTRCMDMVYNACMLYFLFAICAMCVLRFCDGGDTISFDSVGIHTGIYVDESRSVFHAYYAVTLGWCIILFALTTHDELFRVTQKLSTANLAKLPQIAHATVIQHACYMLLLGASGYFYFCENPKVETNVVLNLKDKSANIVILVAMVVIGIAMFVFYPTVLEPSRHSLYMLIYADPDRTRPMSITQYIVFTLLVDVLALLVALFVKDLAVLFAWGGALFAPILCLILPALLFENIIVNPSKTFLHAMLTHQMSGSVRQQQRRRKPSNISRQNHANSSLNSIIATATPPLMNYARTVNEAELQTDDKSSISMLSASLPLHVNTRSNIMTPDMLHQLYTSSYHRLYGAKHERCESDSEEEKQELEKDEVDRKYDQELYDSDDESASPLTDHPRKQSHHKAKSEISVSTTHSKARNLKEMSKTIQDKIENQLNLEKMQRILTLEKANKSWIFWFDRIGSITILCAGIVLFVVGTTCNIAQIIDQSL